MVKIVGIGLTTMDIYRHQHRMYPGGNEYNIAYNARTLGAESAFMGVFSDDVLGQVLKNCIREKGVDISHSHQEPGTSGYAIVDLRDGDRVFLDWNRYGVTDLYPISFTDEEITYLKSFDVACISKYARVSDYQVQRLSQSGVSICYDFCDDFTEDKLRKLGPWIRYAFLSCSHLDQEQTERVLRYLTDLGCTMAIGTRGDRPAIAYDGRQYYYQPVEGVQALDTMGAGDSFISAFLADHIRRTDGDIQHSLAAAAHFAAGVVMTNGALGIGYDISEERIQQLWQMLRDSAQ